MRYQIVALLVVVLTGCLKTPIVVNGLQSEFLPARYSSPGHYRLAERGLGPLLVAADSSEETAGPIVNAGPKEYSDAFWDALADLDLRASREVARGDAETRFADAIALLAGGEYEKAEAAFDGLSNQVMDLVVASGSRMMLASTLLYEHKWPTLRDLSNRSGGTDRQIIGGLEPWGEAFAGINSQVISIPDGGITLPLDVSPVGTPMIRVQINGKQYRFWLDTGSSMTVLSSDVALDAGVPIIAPETLRVGTFAGNAPARPAVLERMGIGSMIISNTPVIVIDSRLMRVRTSAAGVPWSGLPVDGIIGWDTIRQFDISLSYEHRQVTIQKPRDLGIRGTPSQNLMWVGMPLVEVRTKSGVTLHFTLDTGAEASFVNGAVLKKARVTAALSNARPYGLGRTGGQLAKSVPTLALEFGGGVFQLRDLIVFDPPSSRLINWDGILGSDIAQFGTLRIDATNGLLSVGAN